MNLDSAFTWVEGLGAGPLTCIAVVLLGYALKRVDTFPKSYIPITLILFGPVILITAKYGMMRFVVEGMVYSGAVWMFHAQVWKRFIASKGFEPGFESDPELIRKPKQKERK